MKDGECLSMIKEGIIGVYKITNKINNKCYIGQSINIERRFEEHKYTNRSSKHLHRAIKKYGVDNFSFEIVEECKREQLSDKEKYWIKYYNSISPFGYNLTIGGDGGNTFQYRTEQEMQETKKKISQATSGEKNGFYGKQHSEKTKDILRKCNIGKTLSEETKNKLSESLQNHYMPDVAKQKISQATKKQWENKNFRELMKEVNKGNKYVKGNKWNVGRIDIYHKDTHIHKRILIDDLEKYINEGYLKGIPPESKIHHPNVLHCTEENLIGVSFLKDQKKWIAYINFRKKRYGNKTFETKEEAINYRIYLEKIFLQFKSSDLNITEIDVKKSLELGQVVLWCD